MMRLIISRALALVDTGGNGVHIASSIHNGQSTRPCPSAPLLAGAMRRAGLTVQLAPMSLVADNWPAQEAQFAAVRAAPETRATVIQVLQQWAGVMQPRTVLLASPRSFCAGVDRAIEVVEQALRRFGPPIYVRKQIVHNIHVVRRLQEMGAVFVDELHEVPAGATVVFSAHGVSPAVRDLAAARDLRVIDATCPLVTKVHNEARRFAAAGRLVALIGHSGHEEVEGTMGEAPNSTVLVQTAADVAKLQPVPGQQVAYLMQTTLAVAEAERVAGVIRERFPGAAGPHGEDICYATTNRQEAVLSVVQEADLVLVVGSANSSNSVRLVEVAEAAGTTAYLIDDPSDIELGWLSHAHVIGLTAGASAPQTLVDDVVTALGGLGKVTVQQRTLLHEEVFFALPKELR